MLAALAALDLPNHEDSTQHAYLEVRVRLDAPEPGLRARIEAALEGKPVRLAKIETSFAPKPHNDSAPVSLAELEKLQPDDIFAQLYRSRYDADAPPDITAAFAEIMLAAPEVQP